MVLSGGRVLEIVMVDPVINQTFVPQFTPAAYQVPRAGVDGRISSSWLAAKLASLAGMNTTQGLVEQNGDDSFTKRLIGVANSTDIPTRADADARYQGLDADLTAIAALTGTGIAGRTASNTWALSSLTTGRVPRCSGTGAISDSTIRDDATNVAINGAIVSAQRLTIYGGASRALVCTTNGVIQAAFGDLNTGDSGRPWMVLRAIGGLCAFAHANRSGDTTIGTRDCIAWDENQNILIGTTLARPSAGAGCLVFSTSSTALTPATDQCGFWAADQAAGNRAIRWITENGQNGTLYTQAFVAAPTGGGTQDAEARTAINSLRTILINCGLMAAA